MLQDTEREATAGREPLHYQSSEEAEICSDDEKEQQRGRCAQQMGTPTITGGLLCIRRPRVGRIGNGCLEGCRK